MTKDKFYHQFTSEERIVGYKSMQKELWNLDFKHPIRLLFHLAWLDFQENKFSYDGATFVRDRYKETTFEVAAFIHDWRNSNGYVGKTIDNEFLTIMIDLDYHYKLIIRRYILMRLFTWTNIIRHRLYKTFKKGVPTNYYKL